MRKKNRAFRESLIDIKEKVAEGLGFAMALGNHPGNLP